MNRRKLFGLAIGGMAGYLFGSLPAYAEMDVKTIAKLIRQEFDPVCRKYLFENYDDIKDDLRNDCVNVLTKIKNTGLIYDSVLSLSDQNPRVFIDIGIRLKEDHDGYWYYLPITIG